MNSKKSRKTSSLSDREVAKARFLGGETLPQIADSMGVSLRTLQRWQKSARPQWVAIKAEMPDSDLKSSPSAPRQLRTVRIQAASDELRTIDTAIAHVSADIATDIQGKGQLATALVRLYERREKLQPQTLEQLLEVIATWLDRNNMDLREFAAALKAKLTTTPAIDGEQND
jgi:hypothetical protein